jgi:hypothetical protein
MYIYITHIYISIYVCVSIYISFYGDIVLSHKWGNKVQNGGANPSNSKLEIVNLRVFKQKQNTMAESSH